MTDTKDSPVAGEPVEPTAAELFAAHWFEAPHNPIGEFGRKCHAAGRAFERSLKQPVPDPQPPAPELVERVAKMAKAFLTNNDGCSDFARAVLAEIAPADSLKRITLAITDGMHDWWETDRIIAHVKGIQSNLGSAHQRIDSAQKRVAELEAEMAALRAELAEAQAAERETGLRLMRQLQSALVERDTEKARAERAEAEAKRCATGWDSSATIANSLIVELEAAVKAAESAQRDGNGEVLRLEAYLVSEQKNWLKALNEQAEMLTQAKARIAELEAAHAQERVMANQHLADWHDAKRDLAAVTRERDELAKIREADDKNQGDIISIWDMVARFGGRHDGVVEHVRRAVAQVDSLTRELAEAREELERELTTANLLRRLELAVIQMNPKHKNVTITEALRALSAHRAKPSPEVPSVVERMRALEESTRQSPPYETAPTLEKGVSDEQFRSLRQYLCAANLEQRGVDDHGWLADKVLEILGLHRVVRVKPEKAPLQATLDRLENKWPMSGKITEADGPLFIPGPHDGRGERSGQVDECAKWCADAEQYLGAQGFGPYREGDVVPWNAGQPEAKAALPIDKADERIVDELMAKRAATLGEKPLLGPHAGTVADHERRLYQLEKWVLGDTDDEAEAEIEIRAEREARKL